MAILEFIEGPQAGKVVTLGAQTHLGRLSGVSAESSSVISFSDERVSRQHARIVRRGDNFFIEDLNSTNGTVLRGLKLRPWIPYPLHDGDEIGVCTTRLRFRDTPRPSSADAVAAGMTDWGPSIVTEGHVADPAQTLVWTVHADQERTARVATIDAAALPPGLPEGDDATIGGIEEALKRLQAVAQVSIALGAVADRPTVLQRILDCIFQVFSAAERCFVMLRDPESGQLRPVAARTRGVAEEVPTDVAISRSIVSDVVTHRRAVLSYDAMSDDRFGSGASSIMRLSIRSLMCAPLVAGEELLGLVQVDSSTSADKFAADDLQVLVGICAQMAIAVKNGNLYSDIERLFEGFISACVQAIEARDPSTAGHSFRVAEFAERLAMSVSETTRYGFADVRFTPQQLREIRYAAMLHDFGKIAVREELLTKAAKLPPQRLKAVRERFQGARARVESLVYRRLLEELEGDGLEAAELSARRAAAEAEIAAELERLDDFLLAVERANQPVPVSEEAVQQLLALGAYRLEDWEQECASLLESGELDYLTASSGSLSPAERLEVESHVSHTFAFLSLIPWTDDLKDLPAIAYAHHEKMDGSGYPRGLKAEEIPLQSRILTIADIYDALTASDRPYRPRISERDATGYLREEADAGRLDAGLVSLFIECQPRRTGDG